MMKMIGENNKSERRSRDQIETLIDAFKDKSCLCTTSELSFRTQQNQPAYLSSVATRIV